jgi:hypothetical protein
VVVTFDARLWTWDARREDTWVFASLPTEVSEEIRHRAGPPRRGFGSLRVKVTIGGTTWRTSVFPDKARDCYVLPVKQQVRRAESLDDGDTATITVEFLELA